MTQGPRATDASGHKNHGVYEDGVVFYLDGPPIRMTQPQSTRPAGRPFCRRPDEGVAPGIGKQL